MPGRPQHKIERIYDDPARIEELKQGLRAMQERCERGEATGLDPLQPAFVLAVIEAGGWGELTPRRQARLALFLTTEISESAMAREEKVDFCSIWVSNRLALKILHAYFVRVCPDAAKRFPSEIVIRGKDPGVMSRKSGKVGGQVIHGKYIGWREIPRKRRKVREGTRD